MVLNTPTAGAHHARLISHGDAWQLVDDEVTGGIWSDGWVTSLPVTSRVTALLGNEEGATEVRFTPFSGASAVATGPNTIAAGNLAQHLATAQTEVVSRGGPLPGSEQERIATARTEVLGHGGLPPPAVPAQAGAAPPVPPQAMQAPTIMASDSRPGSAGGPGQPPVPVLVTRLGREQRIFPVGTRVRVGRDPSLELVSMNPLVSRETHGVITSDPDGATYTDQSRRGSFLNGKQLHGPLDHRVGDPAPGRPGHRRGTGHHAPAQQRPPGPQPRTPGAEHADAHDRRGGRDRGHRRGGSRRAGHELQTPGHGRVGPAPARSAAACSRPSCSTPRPPPSGCSSAPRPTTPAGVRARSSARTASS